MERLRRVFLCGAEIAYSNGRRRAFRNDRSTYNISYRARRDDSNKGWLAGERSEISDYVDEESGAGS